MPAGFEAYTENGGVVQIDENYPVLALRYTGSATVVNRHPASMNFSSFIAKTVDITVTAESPQFFIQANSGRFGVIAISSSGNQWTFRVIGFEDQPTFNYFIFDWPAAAASGAGLEVYNAQGKVFFSSLYRPMVVAGFTTGNQTAQLPSGRSYAVGYGSRITLQETSEVYTDQTINTFWTYRLATASAAPTAGSNALFGTVYDDPIAGGVSQGGGSPVAPSGDLGGWGADSTLTVIDVTDLVGAPGGVTAPSVSVSTTFRAVTGTSGTTITDAVTCSASGGAGGPYSFLWDKVGGDAAIVAFGASNSASFRTQWVNQPAGTSAQAQFRCRVTDGGGNVTYSQPVTFEHNQAANSATPAPLNLTDQVISTNDYYGGFVVSRTITGITQPIVIRVNVSNRSGNISAGGCYFRKNGVGLGTGMLWTAGEDAREGTFNAGDSLEIFIDAQTFSGVKSGKFYTTLTNVTTGAPLGGFWTQCDVDRDNNYNITDTAPDTISNWPTINAAVNDEDYTWSTSWYGAHYVAGIDAPITLRAQAYNYAQTGSVSVADVLVYTWPPGAPDFVYRGTFSAINGWLDLPDVTNGTRVALNPRVATANGKATVNVQLVLWSLTGPQATAFANTTHSFTVDNDNTSDKSLNGFTLPDLTINTNAPTGLSNDGAFVVQGITQPVVLRFSRGDQVDQFSAGSVFTRRLYVYRLPAGSQNWIENFIGAGANNTIDLTVYNGDTILFRTYYETTSGRAETSFRAWIYNLSTGGNQIGTFAVTGIVDADNNHNISGPPVLSFNTTSVFKQEFLFNGQYTTVYSDTGDVVVSVSGGSGALTYSWAKVVGSNTTWNVTGTTQPRFSVSAMTNFQEYAVFRLTVTDALGRTATGDVEVTLGAGDQA